MQALLILFGATLLFGADFSESRITEERDSKSTDGCATSALPCGYYSGRQHFAVVLEFNVYSNRELEFTMFLGGLGTSKEVLDTYVPLVFKIPRVVFEVNRHTGEMTFENELEPVGTLSRFKGSFESITNIADFMAIVKELVPVEVSNQIPAVLTAKYKTDTILAMGMLDLKPEPAALNFLAIIEEGFDDFGDGNVIDSETERLLSHAHVVPRHEDPHIPSALPKRTIAAAAKSVYSVHCGLLLALLAVVAH